MSVVKFIISRLILLVLSIYTIYIGYIYFNQAEMVFIANKLPQDYKFEFNQKFEELNIPSYDGVKLNGLLFKVDDPKGLIFYLHGNAGSLDTWGNNSKIYTKLGYDVFFLDYRGFGKSDGKIENQEQVFRDVLCVFDYLNLKYHYKEKIIIGYSIGTGIAANLATNRKNNMLILQAPYFNFIEFSTTRVPFFPDFMKKFKFETNKYIKEIKTPIYIFHGKSDRLISIENSFKLKKLFKHKDSLFVLENQDHVGINDNNDFQGKINELLK